MKTELKSSKNHLSLLITIKQYATSRNKDITAVNPYKIDILAVFSPMGVPNNINTRGKKTRSDGNNFFIIITPKTPKR